MRVTHAGSFTTLPRRDQVRIVVVAPPALAAAVVVGVAMRLQDAYRRCAWSRRGDRG